MPVEILVIGAIVVVVVVVWYNISNQRDKRRGTGSWAAYGPDPSPQRIAQVDRARALYNQGVSEMVRGNRIRARELWQDSADLGNASALTGMGIVELYAGDKDKAKGYWELAAARGEVPAKMFLMLNKRSGVDFGRREFAPYFLRAENTLNGRESESLDTVIGLALHFGFLDYARKMRDVARASTQTRGI